MKPYNHMGEHCSGYPPLFTSDLKCWNYIKNNQFNNKII